MTAARIRSEAELDRAIKELDALLICGCELSSEEKGKLDRLTKQIRHYEERNIKIPEVSNAKALKSLLESNQISAKKLASITGVEYSSILKFLGDRGVLMSGDGVKIARHFKLRPDFFASLDAHIVNRD